jgi:hypothetical protein
VVSWNDYGLYKNPFELCAVEKDGVVPLETFEGRIPERQTLKQATETKSRSLNLVFGEAGVGKTSFGNYVRQKMLSGYFTHIREIDCQPGLSTSEFVACILYYVYLTIDKTQETKLDAIKKNLQPIYEAYISNSAAAKFSYHYLVEQLRSTANEIKKNGYKGIIVHANNLENFVQEDDKFFKKFVSAARDLFLIDGCHYIFVGNREATDCFYADSKVKTIVSTAIQINNLTLPDIKAVIKNRYAANEIKTYKLVEPIADDTIEFLYNAHNGNIREILSALETAVLYAQRDIKQDIIITPPIAKRTLRIFAENTIESFSPKTYDVLKFIIKKKEATNTEISNELNIIPQNTSSYLRELKKADFITLLKKSKRKKIFAAKFKSIWLSFPKDEGTQASLSEF